MEKIQSVMHQMDHALLLLPIMQPAGKLPYKALYAECTQQNAGKDKLIALLQQQLAQLVQERESLTSLVAVYEKQLDTQAATIAACEQQLAQQQQIILGQAEKLSQQQTIITEQQQQLDKSNKEISRLSAMRYELQQLKKWVYGIKSEKRYQTTEQEQAAVQAAGEQLSLALSADAWGVCSINSRRKIAGHMRVVKEVTPARCGGRHDFPEGLEEEITLLDAPDKLAGARCVGHVDQRQLACDPMRFYIKVNRRLVYLAPKDEDKLNYKQIIAPLPAHPIAQCKMDVSVLVMLTLEKFQYHLPVWRQQQRLRQYGIQLPYSSLCSIVNRVCETLEPLWHLLLKEIMISRLVCMDETRYRVLDNSKKQGKKSHIGWMWACMNPAQAIACFLYQEGRGSKDAYPVLKGYKGYLMTDAYGAYSSFGKQPDVMHLHCLAHARRYFVYALNNDAVRAGYVLDQFFGPLYDIEATCKQEGLDYDGITARRQAESVPLLQALKQWLEKEMPYTMPRSPIHKAISYTLNHYKALTRYTTDGMLPVDNNALEGQIRSIAIGRHNHLFAGSHRGGELAAIMYSFIATCKLQKINTAQWLDDVLRIIKNQPEDKLIQLLPQYWQSPATTKAHNA